MIAATVSLLLLVPALILALPALVDLAALLHRRRVPVRLALGTSPPEPLLFLVPAHDEAMLIRRCIRSLRGQTYPAELLTITVVADNCTDETAGAAREEGATVLVRQTDDKRGKGYAIEWALGRIPLDLYAAVVIVDADTIVDPDYSLQLMRWAPLGEKAIQSYDGMSNEFENWLTTLAGLLTRSRYGIALPLKVAAGLNVPLTGDGTVLGTGLLRRDPWRVLTITEGWELYARYTLHGQRIEYEPEARLYAQETREMAQSRTQRERWTAGRIAAFRLYAGRILREGRASPLERLDLMAELTNVGPVMRAFLAAAGCGLALGFGRPYGWVPAALFASAFLQPTLYAVLALRGHPKPGRALRALARLPLYAGWRVLVGVRTFALSGTKQWIRTARHRESSVL